ncbi:MAG: glycosyltransferase, partial [Bdellovibrionales bacterium]|nr:glycosyltransferase [Bdellovibrionales bacterium]
MEKTSTNSNKKRIAIFVPSMAGGGAERSMLRLADGLAGRNFNVDLVLARAEGPYLADVTNRVRLVDLQAPRVLFCLPALMRYLRREQPAALLSTLDYANIIAIWARRLTGIPRNLIINDQNTISITSRNARQRRQQWVPMLARRFYPWATHIIGNSQGVAADLSKILGNGKRKIEVVYNPVVTPELANKLPGVVEHPWFAPGRPPVFLAVGRLTKQKDFPTLIRAFAQLRKTDKARLLILGEGPDRPALEALVQELGVTEDVSLFGFVENPYAFMKRAKAFILSSRWEGLPTVLIEALYCGVPIIATDCPSGP